eukprot:1144204-Rhodomonas_salina.1
MAWGTVIGWKRLRPRTAPRDLRRKVGILNEHQDSKLPLGCNSIVVRREDIPLADFPGRLSPHLTSFLLSSTKFCMRQHEW